MTDTTATADPTVDPTITSAVERLMRRVEDFPAAGVQFCDLTPVRLPGRVLPLRHLRLLPPVPGRQERLAVTRP